MANFTARLSNWTQNPVNPRSYRSEIDGLRALSVTSVLIYHAEISIDGFKLLTGGFFGVDIFFAISGYLITKLLIDELEMNGKISLSKFYERRIRRILPALVTVIIFCWPLAWAILMPTQLVDFSKSALSTILFGSNFYFFDTLSEYGAESGQLKPLLHTWTLGVEEQFYIFYPIAVIGSLWISKRFAFGALILMTLVSFSLAYTFTTSNHAASFYLLPTRLWELTAGGCVAFANRKCYASAYPNVSQLLSVLGLACVVYALSVGDLQKQHPGIFTLLPVGGTIMILALANRTTLVGKLLSTNLLVITGLISYSLYLWHYPIFAFFRLQNLQETAFEKLLLLGIAVILAGITHLLIENPLRNRRLSSFTTVAGLLAAGYLLTTALSIYAINSEGAAHRHQDLLSVYGKNEFDNRTLRIKSNQVRRDVATKHGFDSYSEHERSHLCFSEQSDSRKILLVGNSHAKNLYIAFQQNKTNFPKDEFAIYRMEINELESQKENLLASPNFEAAQVVLISSKFREDELRKDISALPKFINFIQDQDKVVWLASNSPEFDTYGSDTIFDVMVKRSGSNLRESEVNSMFNTHRRPEIEVTNQILESIASESGISFLHKLDYSCDASVNECTGVTPDGYKAYFDGEHYTLEGARYFARKIREINWLPN